MKKVVCAFLALTMILAMTATALAADVSASYSNGMLTVSTSSDGWFRISVDGQGTDRSLTPRVPTLTFAYALKDGAHRISISSDIVGSGSTTIQVVNGSSTGEGGSQPQPKPTEAPVIKEHDEHVAETIPAVEPTCTKNGLTEGERCTVGGEILTEQQEIPALGHHYVMQQREGKKVNYRCSRCGDTKKVNYTDAVQNRLGNALLIDMNGVYVDYTVKPYDAESKVLVITADLSKEPASEISLYLDTADIVQIIREGFNVIEYVNGKADLVIDLYSISTSWFETESPIQCYVFTTNPSSAEGMVMRVEAQISDTETIPAKTFSGVTLK